MWDGKPVTDLPTFMNLVASSRPGVEIPVSVRRAGKQVMDRFVSGRRPAAQGRMLDYGDVYAAADGRLLEAANIREYEQIHIYNLDNGERFTTYAIQAADNTGIVLRRLDLDHAELHVHVEPPRPALGHGDAELAHAHGDSGRVATPARR